MRPAYFVAEHHRCRRSATHQVDSFPNGGEIHLTRRCLKTCDNAVGCKPGQIGRQRVTKLYLQREAISWLELRARSRCSS